MNPSPSSIRLSVVMPVYNERYTIRQIVRDVLAQDKTAGISSLQLVIVDDGSRDGSREIIRELAEADSRITPVFQTVNQGKTAAINAGIERADGDVIVFQDADLEYDPAEYSRLLRPILAGAADVVFGSRYLTHDFSRVLYFWHSHMNRALTLLSNFFTDLNLTDMETCFKMFRAHLLKSIPIRSSGFGLEPEITAKIAKRRFRVYEVPVSYRGRTYEEGKKVTWRDGLCALYYIVKYWMIDDCVREIPGQETWRSFVQPPPRYKRWLADTVRPLIRNVVLEIGAGPGNLMQHLLPRDNYISVDTDPAGIEYLRSQFGQNASVGVLKADVFAPAGLQEVPGTFDTVLCPDPGGRIFTSPAALENIRGALAPDGHLVLVATSPDAPDADALAPHVRKLLEAAGFELVETRSFNRPGRVVRNLIARLGDSPFLGKAVRKVFDHLVWLFRRIDHLLPWPGLSLIAVARRR
ncbi:MAG TPA: glycosyltransferase [Candidatus Ozemobacteraceae bacterium]|nr:glycosyltransferase [Candidatus Ozemobacteraceae bacterium]